MTGRLAERFKARVPKTRGRKPSQVRILYLPPVRKCLFGISLEESSKLFGQEILVSAEYLNGKGANKIEIKGGVLKDEVLKLYEEFEN